MANATTDRIVLESELPRSCIRRPGTDSGIGPEACGDKQFRNSAFCSSCGRARSDLEQEQAQLQIEHGPNFPRVVEIRSQMQDLDQQIKAEDKKLVERLKSAWEAAIDRERMLTQEPRRRHKRRPEAE